MMLGCTQDCLAVDLCTTSFDQGQGEDIDSSQGLGVTCKKCGTFLLIDDEESLLEHGSSCKYDLHPRSETSMSPEELALDKLIDKLTGRANIVIKTPTNKLRLTISQLRTSIASLKDTMKMTRNAELQLRHLSRKIAQEKKWTPKGKRRPVAPITPVPMETSKGGGTGDPASDIILRDVPIQACSMAAEMPMYTVAGTLLQI